MRAEYRLFAYRYIMSGDKEAAYQFVYPNASGESLKVNARRLLRRKEIRELIDDQLTASVQQATLARVAEEQRQAAEEAATLALKRKKLLAIINGEHKVRRYFRYKDHIEVVEEDCSPYALLRAIEIDHKMIKDFFGGEKNAPGHSGKNKPLLGDYGKPPAPKYRYPAEDPAYDRGFSLPLPPLSEGHDVPFHLIFRESVAMGDDAFMLKHYGEHYLAAHRALQVQKNPALAEEYERQGLEVLQYVPSEEEMMEMRGEFALLRKQAEAKREEQKKLRESGKAIIGHPDGTLPLPEVSPSSTHLPPMSLPELFPNEDNDAPSGAASWAPQEQRIVTHKIIVNEKAVVEKDPEPEYPPEAYNNPYFRRLNPALKGKVNPMSVPRPMQPNPYTQQENDERLTKAWEEMINDPECDFYIPPEQRDPECPNPYIALMRRREEWQNAVNNSNNPGDFLYLNQIEPTTSPDDGQTEN